MQCSWAREGLLSGNNSHFDGCCWVSFTIAQDLLMICFRSHFEINNEPLRAFPIVSSSNKRSWQTPIINRTYVTNKQHKSQLEMFALLKPGPMSAINCVSRKCHGIGEGGGMDMRLGFLPETRLCFPSFREAGSRFVFAWTPEGDGGVFLIKWAWCITNYFWTGRSYIFKVSGCSV